MQLIDEILEYLQYHPMSSRSMSNRRYGKLSMTCAR